MHNTDGIDGANGINGANGITTQIVQMVQVAAVGNKFSFLLIRNEKGWLDLTIDMLRSNN